MSDTKTTNPYVQMAINVITNPWVLAAAGGVASYYIFGREDGKAKKGKTPYLAAGGGAAVGLAAGKLIQYMRTRATQPQLPPGVTQKMVDEYQGPQVVDDSSVSDYYSVGNDPDVDKIFNHDPVTPHQPGIDPLAGAPGMAYEEQGVPLQSDIEDPMGLGSLDGTNLGSNGFGSLSQDDGFSAYDPGIEEAIHDAKKPN